MTCRILGFPTDEKRLSFLSDFLTKNDGQRNYLPCDFCKGGITKFFGSCFWKQDVSKLQFSLRGFGILYSTCPEEQLRIFFKNSLISFVSEFIYFRIFSETFLDFCQQIFGRVFKTAIYVFRGTHCLNFFSEFSGSHYIFSDFERVKNFRIYVENFAAVCQNCILCVQRNILRKNL